MRHILAFGDSLFTGYHLARGQSYPARLEAALRQRGVNARVTNAGVMGDTTATGRQRLKFVMGSMPARPDLAIVELGGNDLRNGVPPAEISENLAGILAELRDRRVPVLLMGTRAQAGGSDADASQFDAIYSALAVRFGTGLVPDFQALLRDQPKLLQRDHLHPTAEGVEMLVAATVDTVIAALPKPN